MGGFFGNLPSPVYPRSRALGRSDKSSLGVEPGVVGPGDIVDLGKLPTDVQPGPIGAQRLHQEITVPALDLRVPPSSRVQNPAKRVGREAPRLSGSKIPFYREAGESLA
jgi:hypothetical protein